MLKKEKGCTKMYVLYFFMLLNILFILKMITGVMKKLVEWIRYSLDIENAQRLPIAVSYVTFLLKECLNSF